MWTDLRRAESQDLFRERPQDHSPQTPVAWFTPALLEQPARETAWEKASQLATPETESQETGITESGMTPAVEQSLIPHAEQSAGLDLRQLTPKP